LRNRAKKLNLSRNLTFLPFQSDYRKIIALLKSSKLFILPSKREGFGIAVLEAQASGCVPLVLKHPKNAAQELVQHEKTGVLFEDNPHALATEIEKLLRDNKRRTKLSMKGREYAKNHGWEVIAEKVLTLYSSLLTQQ